MRYIIKYCVVGMLLLLAGCAREAGGRAATPATPAAGQPREILPAVPDSLRTVEERAAYAVSHFWESLDFSEPGLASDTAFVEQNFANFVALAEMAPAEAADSGISRLVKGAAVNAGLLNLIAETSASYLDHPNSPMRNEELYILFLRHLSESPAVADHEKLRLQHRLDEALKNRPGTVAADFRLETRYGTHSTLHSLLRRAGRTLLIFYDPDCTHCREVMQQIADATLADDVQIVAVDAEDDHERWVYTHAAYPVSWAVCYATTPILDDELYALPASPTLYVLEADGTVVLKDPDVVTALRRLSTPLP